MHTCLVEDRSNHIRINGLRLASDMSVCETPLVNWQVWAGDRTRRLRKLRRWTQEKLASEAKVDKETINRFENGIGNPTLRTAQKIAGAFGLTVDDLVARPITGPDSDARASDLIRHADTEESAVVARSLSPSPSLALSDTTEGSKKNPGAEGTEHVGDDSAVSSGGDDPLRTILGRLDLLAFRLAALGDIPALVDKLRNTISDAEALSQLITQRAAAFEMSDPDRRRAAAAVVTAGRRARPAREPRARAPRKGGRKR